MMNYPGPQASRLCMGRPAEVPGCSLDTVDGGGSKSPHLQWSGRCEIHLNNRPGEIVECYLPT